MERFECELSIFLVLDDDRVRYGFPIMDQELAVILDKQYGTSVARKVATSAAVPPAASGSSPGAVAFRAPAKPNDIVD